MLVGLKCFFKKFKSSTNLMKMDEIAKVIGQWMKFKKNKKFNAF
jgi:hypothetical protein